MGGGNLVLYAPAHWMVRGPGLNLCPPHPLFARAHCTSPVKPAEECFGETNWSDVFFLVSFLSLAKPFVHSVFFVTWVYCIRDVSDICFV